MEKKKNRIMFFSMVSPSHGWTRWTTWVTQFMPLEIKNWTVDKQEPSSVRRQVKSSTHLSSHFLLTNFLQLTFTCNSWYGSVLWDLYGSAAGVAFRTWNTTVKIAWDVDRATHTYIVDHLLARDMPSVRQQILKRYIKFVTSLLSSPNPVINLLAVLSANTVQSTTGRNILNIKQEFNMDPLTTPRDKFIVNKSVIPVGGEENLVLLMDLIMAKQAEVEDDIVTELEGLIKITCVG